MHIMLSFVWEHVHSAEFVYHIVRMLLSYLTLGLLAIRVHDALAIYHIPPMVPSISSSYRANDA